jgi:large subunit ribosomal protein L19
MTGADENNTTAENVEAAEQAAQTEAAPQKAATKREPTSLAQALKAITASSARTDMPNFKTGDTLRVHAKIVEGNKERVQMFEGVVIKRTKGDHTDASFTVRKISYNVGVERTFLLHSPRIEKVEVVSRAKVRRSRLFYLRPLRGKAARMKTLYGTAETSTKDSNQAA